MDSQLNGYELITDKYIVIWFDSLLLILKA